MSKIPFVSLFINVLLLRISDYNNLIENYSYQPLLYVKIARLILHYVLLFRKMVQKQ